MSITKTIGGDRLGSGNKMKQSMHNYQRSNHNLSYIWKSTMAPGTLVPFLFEPMQIDDTWDIKLDAHVMTNPTIGALFGSYKLQLDVFTCPIRLYQGLLHNNKIGIGMEMDKVKLPLLRYKMPNLKEMILSQKQIEAETEPIDMQQINPSSLLSYLGQKGAYTIEDPEVVVERNGLGMLMYYDIYKNYYANKQEEVGAYINYKSTVTNAEIKAVYINFDIASQGMIMYENDAIRITMTDGSTENILFEVADQDQAGNGPAFSISMEELVKEVKTYEFNVNGEKRNWITGLVKKEYSGLTYRSVKVVPTSKRRPEVDTFPLKNIDTMREDILAETRASGAFIIEEYTYPPYGTSLIFDQNIGIMGKNRSYFPMQGLVLKTYQSDLYNNWISTEWIEGENGISALTAVDVSDGTLNLDSLLLAKKVYNMLTRIAISGGTYGNWLEAIYGSSGNIMSETPIYEGGLSKEIVFQEVISNSASENEPLGTIAGRGTLSKKHKGGKMIVRCKEPSYLMGIVSITPRIDYSQGNRWDIHLKTMNDFHKPELDAIGFQDLITDQMAAADTYTNDSGQPIFNAAGKVPAWMNYMTNVDKSFGNFADENNQMFMTLNRRYEYEIDTSVDPEFRRVKILDLTTYIDPEKFNYIFAQTDITAQNFWVLLSVGLQTRRKISARQIPNL